MQKKKWVRLGLAVVIVSGAFAGMSAAGCGGDDSSGTPKPDGGKSDSSIPPGDSGPGPDSGQLGDSATKSDGDGGPTVPNAKVYVIHAATDPLAPPFRFCFGIGSPADGGTVSIAPFPPLPDSPLAPSFPIAGFFPGFGGPLNSAPQLKSFDLNTLTLSLYAIDATKIANDTVDGGPDGGAEPECASFIGAAGAGGGTLTLNTDFWYLGTIPQGTLKHGETWVAAITGCVPGEPNPTGPSSPGNLLCQNPKLPAYSMANGNLTLTAWQLDNTTAVSGDAGLGAQFANASPAWDVETLGAVAADAGNAGTAAGFWTETPGVVSDAGAGDGAASDAASDAATVDAAPPPPVFGFTPINCGTTGCTGSFGTLSPAALVTVPGIPLNAQNAGFATAIAFSGGSPPILQVPVGCTVGASCISPFAYPMPDIDAVTNGATLNAQGIVTTPAGGSYAYGKGYAFILVGDPLQPQTTGGVFNGKAAHFLGFPTANP